MKRGPVARALVACIGLYQRASVLGQARCRYLPTCSEYAREAIDTRGAAMGTWLAVRRILRCHPWGGHGYDPVPTQSNRPSPLVTTRRHANGA